jgi:hypothetical protein
MLVHTEQLIKNWWAEGDIPVQTTSRVVYLVDGHLRGEAPEAVAQ